MKVYKTEQIRNVAILGHGSVGKTTLVEALAFATGAISRQGHVEDGNTVSDFDKEEAKRLFSISTSVVPVEFEDTKINLLDTPGYFDFVGEVYEALSAADAAIIVVSGKSGVEVGTLKAWEYCEKYNIPRLIFVTDMDDDNASFREVTVALNEKFGRKIAPFHIPIRENQKFVGFVNVVKMEGRRFTDSFRYEKCDIPEYVEKQLKVSRDSLIEAVAETSEELMERYFEGDEFTNEEISAALRENVCRGEIVPVLMGSGLHGQGTNMLLQAIVKYFPSPAQCQAHGHDVNREMVLLNFDPAKHCSAYVWKTMIDPYAGRFSILKVVTGSLKSGMTVYNINKDREDKINKVYVLRGKESIEVSELNAGDIGALAKIDDISTGDTLAGKGATVFYDNLKLPEPFTYKAFRAKKKGEEDKVASGISKLMEEDLTLRLVNDSENRQTLLYGIGDQQLDVVASKLKNRYNVDIELDKPRFAFRETLRKKVQVQGRHKKQTGGHGQFGDVIMEFEPSGDLTTPYVFDERVVGGAVPRNFFPAVEKGLQECVLKGPVAGYPVVGVHATLVDGSYHPVDSSEMAFKMATILAFKQAFEQANPVLLEPIFTVKVTAPADYSGDIMGDMNRRRGRVLGMDHLHGGSQVITAEVPASEMYGYSTDLRSMTGGIGDFTMEFARYEQAPAEVMKAEIEARKSAEEE